MLQRLSFGSSGDESGYYIYSGGGGANDGDEDGDGVPDPVEIEDEYGDKQPETDLEKLLKCFDNVPNAGAVYTIKLNVDVANNNKPEKWFKVGSGVGHVFLTITKMNEEQIVTQTFGFYRKGAINPMSPFSTSEGQIINNGNREINASIQMNISQAQFETVKQKARDLQGNDYNIGSYNCANFALEVFNSVRANPITTDPLHVVIPNLLNFQGIDEYIQNSPQKLFTELKEMKEAGGPEASKIRIDQTHGTRSRLSDGPCE
jgi:hypothetical protein